MWASPLSLGFSISAGKTEWTFVITELTSQISYEAYILFLGFKLQMTY